MIDKPKKERRFLKALGRVGEILIQDFLIKIGSNLIKKIGGKKTLPSILFLLASLSLFAQYPATGNKQRLGYQTTGDGLVFRGRANDTTALKPSTINNAYFILDTVNNVLFNYIKTKGGWKFSNGDTIIINNNFTQPVDSLFFNVGVPTNNVDTAKMRWDSDLATVVLGLNDNVPNELGFKNFWLVKNQTGSTITKGSIVYANGTVGASGRITVAKFIANGSIDAKYLLGITAHDLSNGEDGYVISFGKIRQVNTDTFLVGAILYPSPTVAGVWTDVEPVAPNIDMPIGFCINSHVNNGTIAIRVASGYKLSELHDVSISSPVENSSLYYKSGLWRDTTATLLLSDTASMLTNYLRSGVAASTYLTQSNAASTYLPLTGGTLTGALSGTTGTFTGLNVNNTNVNGEGVLTLKSYNFNFPNRIQFGDGSVIRKEITQNAESNMLFRTFAVGGGEGGYSFYTRRNPNAEILSLNIDRDGNSNFYGTLGVTGATTLSSTLGVTGTTTLSAPLTVNSSAVFNEGSAIADFRVESDGNANMLFVDGTNNRVGIGTNAPTKTLDVNGTLVVTGIANFSNQMTISGSVSGSNRLLGKNTSNDGIGDVILGTGLTLSPSNVLDANTTDTTSLSNRINLKYDKTGGTISGAVTLSTTSATPTNLLGKDGSNVVGTVTTLAQTGLMKAGGTTTNTSSVGIITVAHGLSYTPSQVFVTLAQQSNYIAVCHAITSTNLSFTFYDSTTGIALNNVSVGFFWLAIK